MIESIKCIKNLGPFEQVEKLKLGKVTLVYGENGRGKTMLSEVFRSLATGAPELVEGRKRLGADADPVVVLETRDKEVVHWSRDSWLTNGELPKVSVFNDGFVDANVYSGLDVSSAQRQGLHSVVVGEEGVAKAKSYETAVNDAKDRQSEVKCLSDTIKGAVPGVPDVNAFCREETPPDIDERVKAKCSEIKSAKAAEQIVARELLPELRPPSILVKEAKVLLRRGIADVTGEAVDRVRRHLTRLWAGGEAWVHQGWQHSKQADYCPYCGQSLSGVQLAADFADHFEGAYAQFKNEIAEFQAKFKAANDESQRREFVARAAETEKLQLDWARDGLDGETLDFRAKEIADLWQTLADGVSSALAGKSDAPLEKQGLDEQTEQALVAFEEARKGFESENCRVREMNLEIKRLKESVITADLQKLRAEAENLSRLKKRGESDVVGLCNRYGTARVEHQCAERTRDQKRKEMERYNEEIFRVYGYAINEHLRKFGTGFRIEGFKEEKPGGRVTSSFAISINRTQVPVRSENPEASQPSFRNTLSAGDRTALALAFFFASLDQRKDLGNRMVVVDDPVASLDDGRRQATLDEISKLAGKVGTLVVMSHDRSLLCQLASRHYRIKVQQALQVGGSTDLSSVEPWDVDEACRSEFANRAIRMQKFEGTPSQLYSDVREMIESYLPLAFAGTYDQGNGVGGFIDQCERLIEKGTPLLLQHELDELRSLHRFSSRNSHWDEASNDNLSQLRTYVERTLNFCRGRRGMHTE